MRDNEQIIRELYAAAEGPVPDVDKFLSMFSKDGYMWDMATGLKFQGHAISESITGFATAFPDVHREILSAYVADNVVIVELATRGTHKGELSLASETLNPTGKAIDVPTCDVYHLENGKITSFHCYNEASVMLRQLGVGFG